MAVLNILVGILLLLLGRRLFWLFVGALGFITGLNLATQFLQGQPQWVIIVVALVAGLLGAVIAIVFQRVAVAIAGFLAGGNFVWYALSILQVDLGDLSWLAYIVGGIIGAVLLFVLFDWALIILSSLTGAGLIAQAVPADDTARVVLFAVLTIIGIIVQAGLARRYPDEMPRRTYTRRRPVRRRG
ncbi:MAG: TMEM198/TM7SF3 family protein [Chloroflexota bacterium]|nr:MAG: TMEM198/TM7SF3 family protein [Chloroflexota bacterium]